MGAGSVREQASSPMHSAVNWGLLGLVIERPSYAYELAQRFERAYEGAVSLSSPSHVYTALASLRERGLVEELHEETRSTRFRTRYQATARGLEEHAQWLVAQVSEERRRQRLLVMQLGALAGTPRRAIAVLDAFEQACMLEAAAAPVADEEIPGTTGLVSRLIGEDTRLALAAKLEWAQYARVQVRALADREGAAAGQRRQPRA